LEPKLAASGSRLIDAPISGAPPTVRSGGAAILVGGEVADVERARPVLELLGDVRHIGPLGSGARLKLVANSMLGAITAAAAELQAAGEAAGLPPDEVFRSLVRLVPALEVRRAGYLGADAPTLFAVRDLRKDLDLALALFHRSDSPTPVTDVVRGVVDEAVRDIGDRDIATIVTRYRSTDA
jgi:3-hydroxyisobutyrate dehydrogenase-like beta-hydroxyacid dehydrogenase